MSKKYIQELISMSDDALNVELENIPVKEFKQALNIALKEQDRDTLNAFSAGVVRQTKTHNVEDFDAPINWLCRCVSDAERKVKAV